MFLLSTGIKKPQASRGKMNSLKNYIIKLFEIVRKKYSMAAPELRKTVNKTFKNSV